MGMKRRGIGTLLLAGTIGLSLTGCSGPASFLDPDADLAFYERVGVLPFDSLARDPLAGEKVASVFYTQLLARGFAEAVDPGQLASAAKRIRGNVPEGTPWSTADLTRLGQEAGIQGVFLGTVRDYTMVAVGRDSYPLVAFDLRFVELASGRMIWSSSQTRRGGPAFLFLGWTEVRTLGELTADMCRDALGTLE